MARDTNKLTKSCTADGGGRDPCKQLATDGEKVKEGAFPPQETPNSEILSRVQLRVSSCCIALEIAWYE